MNTDPARELAIQIEAQEDLYFFSRFMFKERRKYKWLHNWHHRVVCDALMKVYRGETKRLIINIPPRYSKTELAVINFMAWCFGKAPDSEFIHVSYSATLAANNAFQTRNLVQEEA
ncbi:MAG: terminase, partial [Acinetobacter sp.]